MSNNMLALKKVHILTYIATMLFCGVFVSMAFVISLELLAINASFSKTELLNHAIEAYIVWCIFHISTILVYNALASLSTGILFKGQGKPFYEKTTLVKENSKSNIVVLNKYEGKK